MSGPRWHAHITQLSANKIVHMKTKPIRQQPSALQLKDLPDEAGAGTCWRARCSAQRVAGGGAVLAFAAAADGAGGGTAASGAGSLFCGCARSGGRLPGAAASAAAPAAPLPSRPAAGAGRPCGTARQHSTTSGCRACGQHSGGCWQRLRSRPHRSVLES